MDPRVEPEDDRRGVEPEDDKDRPEDDRQLQARIVSRLEYSASIIMNHKAVSLGEVMD
jgi:hypothetical protein